MSGLIEIPIIFFLIELPNASLDSITLVSVLNVISLSFLNTVISILSDVLVFMNVETSRILKILLLSMDKIIFESKLKNIHFMHLPFNTLEENKKWIMGCQCDYCRKIKYKYKRKLYNKQLNDPDYFYSRMPLSSVSYYNDENYYLNERNDFVQSVFLFRDSSSSVRAAQNIYNYYKNCYKGERR